MTAYSDYTGIYAHDIDPNSDSNVAVNSLTHGDNGATATDTDITKVKLYQEEIKKKRC